MAGEGEQVHRFKEVIIFFANVTKSSIIISLGNALSKG